MRVDRVFLDVVQVTRAYGRHRSGMLAARLRVKSRVSEPEQVLRLFPWLVPDRGPADRVGHVAADHRRGGRMAGPVRGLRRRRYQGLQVAVVLEADHVDQVAGFEPGEADLDPAGGLRADQDDAPALGRALVHQQAGRAVPLDDRPGDPADLGPDPVEHRPARVAAADNCVVALPEGRRGDRAAAPGFGGGGDRKALFAAVRMQN